MRALLACIVVSLGAAAALAPPGGATNECKGVRTCIRVSGPWVLVPARGTARYLLACPGGSVVAGLDAQVTSRGVRVDFVGRLGAPVGPGVTTTQSALFRAVSVSSRAQFFQPLLGCVPPQGGGGRSTVSARVSPPGPALELRARIVVVAPGTVRFGRVACLAAERLAGSWQAIAFRTTKPPTAANVGFVTTRTVVLGKRVVLTASAADGLSIDVHAIAQVGVECAP